MHHFFAYMARMRYIDRWALMRNSYTENIQEHSHQVAILAHALAVLRNEYFGGQVDAGAVAVAALYHDASEILTGDLSLVLPKRILDDIVEMIYALDKIAPGTANEDTLLYGVEVKFYNMEVEVNKKLESNQHPGLYIIGDGSGITHSLSHASASGVYVARNILE